jgi:AraC-like DNA-binding protein
MSGIALTKSKHLLPYATVLRKHGVRVSPLLKMANLPSTCLDDPETLIPAVCGGYFRKLAEQKSGNRNISLEASQHLEVRQLSFAQALLGQPTVAASILKFCSLVSSETSNGSFELHRLPSGEHWFGARIQTAGAPGEWHVTLYVLCWMLKLARLSTPAWSPPEILINSKASPDHFEAIEKLGSTARLEQNCNGFIIPASILAQPVSKNIAQGQVTDTNFCTTAPDETYAGSLRQIIRSFAKDGWLSIDQISEVSDTSVRTLQRRLWTERETWSNLIQQCRAEMAGDLLENTDAPMLEIANQLGYKNQSHFTRAFQRWAELSPSQFRKYRSMTSYN